MRVNYSSSFISIICLPTRIKALLRIYDRLWENSNYRLTHEERMTLDEFVKVYPKALKEEFGGKKEER